MDTLNLSLRQRKLLRIIQEHNTYITGKELAKQLNVSSRTIRSDVAEINRDLLPHKARILSERSKGYLFDANNPKKIQEMLQLDMAFFTKEDRVRYLAFRLCLTDEPLNLYDLEDEMYISHTTLEHDLHQLKMDYVVSNPHIKLNQKKDELFFEKDETKKRDILNHLFYKDWNYNTKGNAYYGYHFLDKDIMEYIMEEVPFHMDKYGISMEDPSLVSLNLAIAIMYHRIKSGHPLTDAAPVSTPDTQALLATNSLFEALEGQFHCSFEQIEKDAIYQRIASAHLIDASKLNFQTVSFYFESAIINLADRYLEKIKTVFNIDFQKDEDFYISLLIYIRHLQTSIPIFNTQGNDNIVKQNLIVEYEIAYLFQELALNYMGYYINQTELLYLAQCISGALEFLYETHPEAKLKVVICCHLNMPAAWALKRRILGAFDKYLYITSLMPVNIKNAYAFSDTDLIISTVQKKITDNLNTDILYLETFMTSKDYLKLASYIRQKQLERLYPAMRFSLIQLLENAYWHEKILADDRFTLIESMAADFSNDHLTGEGYLEDILRRESISSNAVRHGLVFLHSLLPSADTKLSISTLTHRIIWNSHKIRIVILAAFRPEDIPLVFWLLHEFYNESIDVDMLKLLKTKKEIIEFFSK